MLRSLTLPLFLFTALVLSAQSVSERAAVRVTATVQSTPAITLSWAPISSTTSLTIYRKLKTATSWGSAVATPSSTATSWTDNSVSTGTNYEYKVVRISAGVTGIGYINTGVQVPVVDYRGKIILLVDNTLTSSLATELTQLTNDLRADGWGVIRSDVSRTASVTSIKSIVQGHYNSDPANVKALYIIGHVPVPYSGNITPDGHEDTRGARPTDAYYADVNGTWTDNTVNTTITSQQRTWNTPGDGKFDQSDLPSSVELQVGRVDMYDLPAFGTSEVQLMRNYLNKAHNYKVKGWVPNPRAVLVDNLQWLGNPVAASGWRASALVGQISPEPAAPVLNFRNYINGQSYLWTAHYGGGLIAVDNGVSTYNGTDGGVTTQELASSVTMGGVFNMALGSFFYDFDSRNNFLRAVIARGDGLTNCWAGIPSWYFHHMGLGENIGYSVAASMNNTGLYLPLTEGWQSSIGRTHMNLMGDPSLRLKMVAPPSNLVVSNSGGYAAFSWTANPEGAMGYHIYQVDVNNGVTTRLTSSMVSGTSWNSGTVPFVAGRQYMVRAVMLEISASGSYYNMSLGAMAVSSGAGAADCLGVVGGSATVGSSCNDNNPCTINDVYNANCQCVGTSITPAASISAAGPTTFCTGGSVVLNANTGTGLSYVWRRDNAVISGATSSSYTATLAGSYTVTVTYSGCSTSSSAVVISLTSAPTATLTAAGSTTFCTGGSVLLNANTGTGYTYGWKRNGTTISGATSSSYTATLAGSYTVTVSIGSCATTSSALTVNVSGGTVPTATAQGATSFCNGGSVVLSTNTASGNSYQWRLNGNSINGATNSSYTATQTGSYTVTVTNGVCTATSNAISVSASGSMGTPVITPQGSTDLCSGGNVILTTQQSSGYSYQWYLDGSALPGATSYAYTAFWNGAHTVVVSNGSCSATSAAVAINVGSQAANTIAASGSTSFCAGGSVTLSGNTGSGYTYSWSRNGSLINGATSSSYSATLAGTYTRTVNNGGCSSTSNSITVTVSSGSAPTITAQGPTSFCSGGSVVLAATTASGNSYVWRRNGTTISGATSSSYTATLAGSYTVVVTNGSCSGTSNAVTVTVSTAGTPTITAQGPTSFCSGGSVVLAATTASGNSYVWRRNGTTISGATSNSYTATQAGSYTVVVTNGSCSGTSSAITVNVSGSGVTPVITAYGPTSFCTGGNVILVTQQASGNTYQWRLNGNVISGATSYAYTAYMDGAVTVTVSNGSCTATSAAVNIQVGSTPVASITANGPTTFCSGGSVTLSGNTGAGYSYSWTRNGSVISGATSSSYTATLAGSYTRTVTNNGCSATSSVITVSVGNGTTPVITPQSTTSFCNGGSVVLTTASASGNSYVWRRNGSAISGATGSSYTATLSGSYTVTVTNGGCSGTSAAVTVSASSSGTTPTVTALGPTSFCSGGNVILMTQQSAGATYQWRYNGIAISGATSYAYTAYLNGAFTVTVTSGTCTATSAPINVSVGTGPVASITTNGPTAFCYGGSVTLNATAGTGYFYIWYRNGSPINGANSSTYEATLTGYYSVQVSLPGCSSTSSSVFVRAYSTPNVVCNANPGAGTVSAIAWGGLGPYSYNWNTSPTSNSASANVSTSGTYTVVITDSRGCTATCSTTIDLPTSNDCMGTRTETQEVWGATPAWNNAAGFLMNNFAAAFPAPNYLTIGCGNRRMRLTSSSAVAAFLPSYGAIARLPFGTMQNPTNYGNTFAGQLVALKLSVRFDEYDNAYSPSSTLLKDMVVASGLFAGWTVQQVIDAADEKIGNCGNSYTREALNDALTAINLGYAGGTVNSGYLLCPDGSGMAPEPVQDEAPVLGTAKSLHVEPILVDVFPNPTSGATVFAFTPTAPDQHVTFELRALNGALLTSRDLGTLPEGIQHRIDWDATGTTAGLYLYRITSGTEVLTGKVIVQ
ncbi:MAG: T9SS type A sorting domain-containing protein [Flavobacteriales bacterium]|nr:T9SS type A sorting domain-containing protein [Flavobacteriales bacterium]